MSLPIEQLLMPRYMVIADFWNNPFSLGQVLILEYNRAQKVWFYNLVENDGFRIIYEIEFKEYPHLFRPMPWYEGRKVEEMPEYLKYPSAPNPEVFPVFKVNKWVDVSGKWEYGFNGKLVDLQNDFIPATSEEYISHINKTK